MRLRAFFRDEATRLAIYFVLLLEVWETVFFGTNLGHYIQFYHQSKLMFIGLLALVALGTGLAFLYVRLSLALKLPLRLLALVLFAVGIVVEYGYAATLGRFSTAEDIGQALTFVDATAFLEYGWLYAPWACLVPVAAYGFLLLRFASVKERSGMAFGAGLALIVVFYSVAFPFSHGTFPTLSFSAFSRSVVFATWEHLLGYNVTRAQHSFSSKQTPANNVVFIVDESVRPDHLGVNQYRRPTTPFLRRLRDEGRLTNWGTAVSGATSSVASNALLLTGVQRVPDTFAYTKRWPTIFQYAKTMGYKTYYFDASSSNFWLGSKSDLDSIDEWRNQEVLGPSTIDADFAVAREVRRIISNSTGNFIWVNKRGSHFPYHDNFPTGAMIWGPVMDSNTTKFSDAIKSRNRRRLVNSYDNSIRYNVDGFFKILFADSPPIPQSTVILYTSDHGETLGEEGATWPHGGATKAEAKVPLLMFGYDPNGLDTGYRASHFNLFPTLLDILGVPRKQRRHAYHVSLLGARAEESGPRHYLAGTALHRGIYSSKKRYD